MSENGHKEIKTNKRGITIIGNTETSNKEAELNERENQLNERENKLNEI